jgi:hypothetical protein
VSSKKPKEVKPSPAADIDVDAGRAPWSATLVIGDATRASVRALLYERVDVLKIGIALLATWLERVRWREGVTVVVVEERVSVRRRLGEVPRQGPGVRRGCSPAVATVRGVAGLTGIWQSGAARVWTLSVRVCMGFFVLYMLLLSLSHIDRGLLDRPGMSWSNLIPMFCGPFQNGFAKRKGKMMAKMMAHKMHRSR